MSDILILNGRVVDPANGVDGERDVLLRQGRVAAVELPGRLQGVTAEETIDAAGMVVAPGLVDVHVHLREPGRRIRSRSGRERLRLRRVGLPVWSRCRIRCR